MSTTSAFRTLQTAIDKARADIETLRDEIAGVRGEIETVASLPKSIAEIEALVDGMIGAERQRGTVLPLAHSLGSDRVDSEAERSYGREDFNEAFEFGEKVDAFALLAWWDPAGLKSRMLRGQPKDGISETERAERLAKLRVKLFGLELDEERQLRELDRVTGGMVARRHDANPAIILAPDSDLDPGAVK